MIRWLRVKDDESIVVIMYTCMVLMGYIEQLWMVGLINLGVGPDNYIVDDVLFIAQQYHYTSLHYFDGTYFPLNSL
jgi:hypothetical protein